MNETGNSRQGRLFILEGPDCVGKTTFARHLARVLNGVYWHVTCTKLLAPAMTDYQLNVIANAKVNLETSSVVLDRLWPSEHCYGPVLRPDSMIDPNRIRMAVSELNPVYVFCFDEKGVTSAMTRHEKNQDPAHPYDSQTYHDVYQNYRELHASMTTGYIGVRPDVEVRYFDERLTDILEVHQYNDAMARALVAKYLSAPQGFKETIAKNYAAEEGRLACTTRIPIQ